MLALNAFGSAYRGRRVLFTGHTGFKGSWSCLWLQALGAKVTGLVLAPPSDPNHWGLLKLSTKDRRIDIRDEAAVRSLFAAETAGETSCADACSIGPDREGNPTIAQVLRDLTGTWPEFRRRVASSPHPHEAGLRQVDCAKAKTRLRWRPIWNEVSSADELTASVADAVTSGLGWATA